MIKDSQKELFDRDETQWLSVSDLMAALMIVFMFVAVALIRVSIQERDKIKQIAIAFQQDQVAIYESLLIEFLPDLERWNARIDRETLTFTFKSPDVLFQNSQKKLSLTYKQLLDDFFPRYMDVLQKYRASITEVRIEGHTSSGWQGASDRTEAYFLNMELSQDRTRSVLDYVYRLRALEPYQEWMKKHVSAVGFSSSKPVMNSEGVEDFSGSRRVSFRVITNAEIKIKQILVE